MFCTNCGTKFEGNFCPICGTPAAGVAAPLFSQTPELSPEEQEEAMASDWPQGLTEEGMQELYKSYRKDESSFACDLALNFNLSPKHATAIARKYMSTHPLPSSMAWLTAKNYPTALSKHRMPSEADFAHFRGEKSRKDIAREQWEAERARIEENRRNGIPMCPKCHSTALQAESGKKFSLSKAVLGDTLLGAGGIAMGIGGANKKKIDVICLNCGYRWVLKIK